MYAVVLSYERRPALRWLDAAHRAGARNDAGGDPTVRAAGRGRGTSDLAIDDRKISGNSMRARRNAFFTTARCSTIFRRARRGTAAGCRRASPSTASRSHGDFLTNVAADAARLRRAIAAAWQAVPADNSMAPPARPPTGCLAVRPPRMERGALKRPRRLPALTSVIRQSRRVLVGMENLTARKRPLYH